MEWRSGMKIIGTKKGKISKFWAKPRGGTVTTQHNPFGTSTNTSGIGTTIQNVFVPVPNIVVPVPQCPKAHIVVVSSI